MQERAQKNISLVLTPVSSASFRVYCSQFSGLVVSSRYPERHKMSRLSPCRQSVLKGVHNNNEVFIISILTLFL